MKTSYEKHLAFVEDYTKHWPSRERDLVIENFDRIYPAKKQRHKICRSQQSIKSYLDRFNITMKRIEALHLYVEIDWAARHFKTRHIEELIFAQIAAGNSKQTIKTNLNGFFEVCSSIGYPAPPRNLSHLFRAIPATPKRRAQNIPDWDVLRDVAISEWKESQEALEGYRRSLRARTAIAAWLLAEVGIRARTLKELSPPENSGSQERDVSQIGHSKLEWDCDRLFLAVDARYLKAGPDFNQMLSEEISNAITSYVDFELALFHKRAIASGGKPTAALWPNECGTQEQSENAMFKCIQRMTERRLGRRLGPNAFRHALAKKLMMEQDGGARLASTRLNNTVNIIDANYVLETSLVPSERANEWIKKIKQEAKTRYADLCNGISPTLDHSRF